MAWNEPEKDDKEKDPWTGRRRKDDEDQFDESLRQFKEKVSAFFGGRSSGQGGGSSGGGNGSGANALLGGLGAVFIVGIILVLWLISGIFIVQPGERGVVLRFGRYHSTVEPGPHWIPRFVDSVYIVNEQKVSSYSYESDMLTVDENIVSVSIAVQYRIQNARDYLFNVLNPVGSLQQATASSLRQVIGNNRLNAILTTGRETVRSQVQKQLNTILERYHTGLLITDVALQPAKAPEPVKPAFDDAINAQEDEQRYINQAEADALKFGQEARGQVQRLLNEAGAYKQQVVLEARANTARFLALLPQFQQAPLVTRERLYVDAIESVLAHTTKILVDQGKSGNNMFYLPLDKILANSKNAATGDASDEQEQTATPVVLHQTTTSDGRPSRDVGRYTGRSSRAQTFAGRNYD